MFQTFVANVSGHEEYIANVETEVELTARLLTALTSQPNSNLGMDAMKKEIKAYEDACRKRADTILNETFGQGKHKAITDKINRAGADLIKSQSKNIRSLIAVKKKKHTDAEIAAKEGKETWVYCQNLHKKTDEDVQKHIAATAAAHHKPTLKQTALAALASAKTTAKAKTGLGTD